MDNEVLKTYKIKEKVYLNHIILELGVTITNSIACGIAYYKNLGLMFILTIVILMLLLTFLIRDIKEYKFTKAVRKSLE